MIKIWATQGSRAIRPIWTAEEMGLDYELTMMPFPPRVFMKEYLDVNMLGTIPYLSDGEVKMTESVAMAQYLVEKYGPTDLRVSPDELDYYELTSRIADLKDNGVKTVKWEVTRYLKVSFSLTNFIVVLFGIPLVVFREKNSLSFGIGMSVFVIFGYYAFIKFGQSMGFKGQLSPILSAWIGNLIFLSGGIILLIKARK